MNPLDNIKCDWKCSQLATTLCVFVPRHPVFSNEKFGPFLKKKIQKIDLISRFGTKAGLLYE